MTPRFYRDFALDQLPIMPYGLAVRQFSSHNREGKNDDNGAILYVDEHGDRVIFDATGPGCVRSMWSTNIPEDQTLLFYFDGEVEPRYEINTRSFYKGEHQHFPAPLNSFQKLGYWGDLPYAGNSFVPIPFSKSLKISVRGESTFHHILFDQYPYGIDVKTFTGDEDWTSLLQAFGDDYSVFLPQNLTVQEAQCKDFASGDELIILDTDKPGAIRQVIIECDASDTFMQDVLVEMKWDGAIMSQVRCPIGHFFASPLSVDEVRSLPVQVEKSSGDRLRLTSLFPMPFWKSAEVKLINRSGEDFGGVNAQVSISEPYPMDRSGYFCTHYRDGQTDYGRDWLLFSGPGTGWYVGTVQTMHGDHYCEGDEHFSLDGACSPQINGTGTEDYYLACFWPNRHFTMPFAGCVGDVFEKGGRTFPGSYAHPGRYYRFHLELPIPFYTHADMRIQHGSVSNINSHYTSLAFLYVSPAPVYRQTDMIDVGNEESERSHHYKATASEMTGVIESHCEGDLMHFLLRDSGRRHGNGEITFRVAVDQDNNGVRLRRRLDQSVARQRAKVYVDDEYAGTWYHADHNPFLRWFDSDFELHPRLTRGKTAVDIRLVLDGPFTDFRYDVFSFVGHTPSN